MCYYSLPNAGERDRDVLGGYSVALHDVEGMARKPLVGLLVNKCGQNCYWVKKVYVCLEACSRIRGYLQVCQ